MAGVGTHWLSPVNETELTPLSNSPYCLPLSWTSTFLLSSHFTLSMSISPAASDSVSPSSDLSISVSSVRSWPSSSKLELRGSVLSPPLVVASSFPPSQKSVKLKLKCEFKRLGLRKPEKYGEVDYDQNLQHTGEIV